MATAWSLDYCLACDRQTSGEVYCSQSCRLADIEASSSTAASPTSTSYSYNSSKRHSTSSAHGLYLAPAFDFSAYRTGATSRPAATASTRSSRGQPSRPVSGYFGGSPNRGHMRSPSSPKLTPSSSQASLNSMHSIEFRQGLIDGLSGQTRNELREYTNAFDQVRNLKRRMTST